MEAKDTVMSNDDIDGTRFRVLDELEKKAKVNWWDICKAVEGVSGRQASMDAEQFLIDIINTTGVEVAKAQAEISFKAGIKEVVGYIGDYTKPFPNQREWKAKLKEWGIE